MQVILKLTMRMANGRREVLAAADVEVPPHAAKTTLVL
jgi:hypothetical protein